MWRAFTGGPWPWAVLRTSLPWRSIAGMHDRLAHRYFDTDPAIVAATCERELPGLREAVERPLLVVRDEG